MGDKKYLDLLALQTACAKIYPALKAAAVLNKCGILLSLSESKYIKFVDIKNHTSCGESAARSYLAAGVLAGVVEKSQNGTMFRLSDHLALNFLNSPLGETELRVRIFLQNVEEIRAIQDHELAVFEIQKKTGLKQSTLSLKLSKLFIAGYLTRRKEGKTVYYGISDKYLEALGKIAAGLELRKEGVSL